MSKGMKRDYDKALKLYHKGNLKKALEYCEIGISKNLKNNLVLNLKGLILYLKGDLEGAITVRKINKDFNDDEMSKTYIKDADSDIERQKEFERAKILIKELQINEAIEKLNICKKSDFNSIQVNNALAICLLRKGEYEKSREYINKALQINRNDTNAIAIKKELDSFAESTDNRRLVIPIVIFCIIGISITTIFVLKENKDKPLNLKSVENKNIDNNIEENIETEENLDNYIEETENIEVTNEDIENEIFTFEDIEESYISASTYFEEGNYSESKSNLKKVVKASEGSHLNDDILFLLGSTYEKLEDINNSIKCFEEYISMYENGYYIEEAYYKLALSYKNIDLEKGKEYANKLIYNYPKSIYNNSKIDSIISN